MSNGDPTEPGVNESIAQTLEGIRKNVETLLQSHAELMSTTNRILSCLSGHQKLDPPPSAEPLGRYKMAFPDTPWPHYSPEDWSKITIWDDSKP
jgi:hypothetical protein